MSVDIVAKRQEPVALFDSIRHFDDKGNEFWTGRELQRLLGYSKWENFHKNIKRASLSCENSGSVVTSHFRLSSVNSKGRPMDDWVLSRYACYLVAMNGDPMKSEIASAQAYFAVKLMFADRVIHSLTGNATSPFPSQSESFVKDKSGFVYLVKAGHNNTYKIGYSKNVYKRLEQLQTSCPFDMVVIHRIFSTNACLLESKLHDYYSAYWIRGEWFELTMGLVDSFLSVANELDGQIEVEFNQIEDS